MNWAKNDKSLNFREIFKYYRPKLFYNTNLVYHFKALLVTITCNLVSNLETKDKMFSKPCNLVNTSRYNLNFLQII